MGDEADEKPKCKYGEKCYRKNKEHLEKFSHQFKKYTKEKVESSEKMFPIFQKTRRSPSHDEGEEDSKKEKVEANGKGTKRKHDEEKPQESSPSQVSDPNEKSARKEYSMDDRERFIKEKFLVEMPLDFYSVWKFAQKQKSKNPKDAFSDFGLALCGPFDVLNGSFDGITDVTNDDFLIHDRFPLDPPEFQTVIKGKEKHIGYLRDDPKELPVAVCCNVNSDSGWTHLQTLGDNLFAAILVFIKESKASSREKESVGLALEKLAKEDGFSLEKNSQKIKERKKRVVAPTIHSAGIVVPMNNDVGYRELPETDANLKKMIKSIGDCKDEDLRNAKMEKIQEIITYVQFANDECDYGMGLELGQDLFASGYEYFHPQVKQLLKVAYTLLNREEFSKILDSHLQKRKRKHLSVL